MKNRLVQFLLLLSVMMPVGVIAGNLSDYLILQDIGPYKLDKPEKSLPGEPPGGGPRTYDGPAIVGGADHFLDHIDTTYEVMYLGGAGMASPTVSVTQHAGSEADKWLQHEVEFYFRGEVGRRNDSSSFVPVGNFSIYKMSTEYCWISNNVTVLIEYYDENLSKPKPLEIVQAYMNKYPPTVPASHRIFNTPGNDLKWIREEFDRRLWLADKWAGLIQSGDVELSKKLKNMVDSMKVFLNYRAKYFAVEAKTEIENLQGLAEQNNETAIRTKLAEYKEWWAAHKSESISLP